MLFAYSVPVRAIVSAKSAHVPDETQAYYRIYTRLYLLIDGSRYVWELAKLLGVRLYEVLPVLREMERQGIITEKEQFQPLYRPLPVCQPLRVPYYFTHEASDVLEEFNRRFTSLPKYKIYWNVVCCFWQWGRSIVRHG